MTYLVHLFRNFRAAFYHVIHGLFPWIFIDKFIDSEHWSKNGQTNL